MQLLPCEHQPQPSSSEQAQTVLAGAHESTHVLRHDERHVLCVDGHSRHVVVHWSAGAQVLLSLHQPQPTVSAEETTAVAGAAGAAQAMDVQPPQSGGAEPPGVPNAAALSASADDIAHASARLLAAAG